MVSFNSGVEVIPGKGFKLTMAVRESWLLFLLLGVKILLHLAGIHAKSCYIENMIQATERVTCLESEIHVGLILRTEIAVFSG